MSFAKNSDVTNKCKVMSVESHRCAQKYGSNDVTKANDDVTTQGRKRSADGDAAGGEAKKVYKKFKIN